MNKNKQVLIICVITSVSILAFIKYSDIRLTNNGILLNAKTIDWGVSANMGMDLNYEFYYKSKKIIGGNSFYKISGLHEFENKYFPVMYDPHLCSSQLLIEPSDFKRYNLPFPDSLKWVLKYLKQ